MKYDWRRELSEVFRNERLFDEGVEVARTTCVAGASIASATMAVAAYTDNPLTGLPALRECRRRLEGLPFDVGAWVRQLAEPPSYTSIEDPLVPGFGFVDPTRARKIVSACIRLVAASAPLLRLTRCAFFLEHHDELARSLGPLNTAGLAALVFVDHGIGEEEAERLFLLWKLEPAIREAQRARKLGVGRFPFLSEDLVYEGEWPEARSFDLAELARQVGLE